MAIYISQDLYLSGGLNDGYINANNPRIGYRNLLGAASATYDQPDYPASNLLNPSTGEYWLSTNGADTQYVELQAASGLVDYFGVAGHNLAGASVQVQSRISTGASWSNVAPPAMVPDNHPLMWLFQPVANHPHWRLVINPLSGTPPRIAVIYLGPVLTLQRRVYVGHRPAPYAIDSEVVSGMSESGQFLGRVVRRETIESSITQNNVSPEFYRQRIAPFARAAVTRPFFVAWRPGEYPEEIAFAWTTGSIQMENQSANGFVRFEIPFRALAPLRRNGEV